MGATPAEMKSSFSTAKLCGMSCSEKYEEQRKAYGDSSYSWHHSGWTLRLVANFSTPTEIWSQPYDAEEGFNDLADVAKSLLETKMKIDWFVDTLPKKQQAIYAQTIKERQKKQ